MAPGFAGVAPDAAYVVRYLPAYSSLCRGAATPACHGWQFVMNSTKHNAGAGPAPKVLILTPVKDAEPYLDGYVDNIERLDYPQHALAIGFLDSDSRDQTMNALHRLAPRLRARC